jgi:hypothetical protein
LFFIFKLQIGVCGLPIGKTKKITAKFTVNVKRTVAYPQKNSKICKVVDRQCRIRRCKNFILGKSWNARDRKQLTDEGAK